MNDTKFNYGMSAMYVLKKGADTEDVISADPVKDVPKEKAVPDIGSEDILSVPAYEEAADEKTVKRNKIKSLIKLAVIAISIVVVIIISTIAWFTMNREVENNGLAMTAADTPFELKTQGYYGYYDDYLPDEVSKIAADRSSAQQPPSGSLGTLTTESGTSIQWLITADHNAKNYVISTTENIDKGIRPGSYGEMTFWVVPKGQSTVNVSFVLEITPYRTNYVLDGSGNYVFAPGSDTPEESTPISIADDNNFVDVRNYISNHLLFFKKRNTVTPQSGDPSYYTYSDLIPINSSFDLVYDSENNRYTGTLVFENLSETLQDKKFTIYWVWPETLAEAVLPENKQNSGCHAVCTGSEVFNRLKSSPASFLKDYSASDVGNAAELTTDIVSQYYSKLSVEYNNADQEIGDDIGYIMLTLSAVG